MQQLQDDHDNKQHGEQTCPAQTESMEYRPCNPVCCAGLDQQIAERDATATYEDDLPGDLAAASSRSWVFLPKQAALVRRALLEMDQRRNRSIAATPTVKILAPS
ncbi:hypothetical protein [Bradyrhizobium sp. STM 3561]|uniref:hypothetical protein n=1 Tax=Bradyrhizobium sp. STM 3561 TaxID=578923 RepID=UPI00388EA148